MVKLKCSKCGYEWTPRKPAKEIRECPNCKNRKWNAPKPEKKEGEK